MKQPKKVAGVEFDDRDGAFQDTVEIKSQDAQPCEECTTERVTSSHHPAMVFTQPDISAQMRQGGRLCWVVQEIAQENDWPKLFAVPVWVPESEVLR